MSKEIRDITVNGNKVTLRFVERDAWGTIRSRTQVTVRLRNLENALAAAKIVVPWNQVDH